MTATLLVLGSLAVAALCAGLWLARRLRMLALAGGILALLAAIAEGPHAAAELFGQRLPAIVAATQESARAETARSGSSRASHHTIRHRFAAQVCYRAAGSPGIGAGSPTDPAIQAATGEAPTPADRRCQAAPGTGLLRQAELRLDAASFDAMPPGTVLTIVMWQPLGLFELAWTVDDPLLPFLPRPSFGGGALRPATAEVVSITEDRRGRSLLSRRAQDLAVPIAHVRLRYAVPGLPAPLEGVDSIDLAAAAHLAIGAQVPIGYAEGAPRNPQILGAERRHRWRNPLGAVLAFAGVLAVLAGAVLIYRTRRRRAVRPSA